MKTLKITTSVLALSCFLIAKVNAQSYEITEEQYSTIEYLYYGDADYQEASQNNIYNNIIMNMNKQQLLFNKAIKNESSETKTNPLTREKERLVKKYGDGNNRIK